VNVDGLGVQRRWLGPELGPDSLDVEHAYKAALDPRDILDPGRGG
jgi:hypothetical protein